MITEAGRRITSGENPYVSPDPTQYAWRWSPLLAYGFAWIAPIGVLGWSLLHFAALGTLRDWRLIGLFMIAWPFWWDLDVGNVMTFIAIAGVLALRGSFAAQLVFLSMAVSMPRPLMLPLLAWLLWNEPRTRLPFAVILVGHTLAVLLTGWGDEWIDVLLSSAGDHYEHVWNLAPSRWIGSAWIPVAAALAGWLTWKGRIGLASVVVSPYILPQYLLMLMLAVRSEEAPNPRTT